MKTQVDAFGLLPLDYAMLGRKEEMCLWLLEKDEDSAARAPPLTARYSAYQAAITFEWHEVLERLISNGYPVEHVSSKKQRTPLSGSCCAGQWDAKGRTALMIAIDEGHQSLVMSLLQCGVDINIQDNNGVSALHVAVDTRNLDAVKLLLDEKPLLQALGEKFWMQTPIHLAAEHDYEEIVRELHEYGADLEATCMGGFRPIHVAAFHNSLKVARLLATLNVEMNPIATNDWTVLHVAAEKSSVDFVELVLATNPDVNVKLKESFNTPLHLAASAGKSSMCKLLLGRGASIDLPNVTNHTALHLAVLEGHSDTAKILLHYKFSPKKLAVFKSSVLHYAANEGKIEMIMPLIVAGADPEASNVHRQRILHYAARKGHANFIEQLLSAFPDLELDSQDVDGRTALHLAAIAGHHGTIQLLRNRGARQDIQDANKNIAVYYAAWDGHIEVVEQLLSDDNINVQGYIGRTLLSIIALRGHKNIILRLLAGKAMLELADKNRITPLIYAMKMNHTEIANLLIQEGADVHAKDNEHRTLLHHAARNGNQDLVKMLLNHGCDARAITKLGDTPFLEAVYSNSLEIVDQLMERDVDGSKDKNKLGTTCVHAAAEEGNLQMLIKVVNAGANPDLVDRVGRNAMLLAAMKGRHVLVEPLLKLGSDVDGPEDSFWTPLSSACEAGYVRFAEILLSNEAAVKRPTKHTKMSPLHHATAMRNSQIIRRLIGHGADVSSRDVYANSPLDYAWTHPPSFIATGHPRTQYKPLDPSAHSAILWDTLQYQLKRLLSIGTPASIEAENDRLWTLETTANSFLYLRDKEHDQAIKYIFMELSFGANPADLRPIMECDMCNISLNRLDLYLCRQCHNVRLCTTCYEIYTEGKRTPNSALNGVRELEQLERAIQPLKEAMLPVINELPLKFAFFVFSFFTSVGTWVNIKRKEYEAWESKYNEDGHYNSRKRPGQKLLNLLEEGTQLAKSDANKELDLINDETEESAVLHKKLSDYHRIHNVIHEYKEFYCSGHEYLHVAEKEYDQVVLDSHIFQPNHRLSSEWIGELLEKCSSVHPVDETGTEPAQAQSEESSTTAIPHESFKQAIDEVEVSKKVMEAPAQTRPEMPQGLRSLFALDCPQGSAPEEEGQKSVGDDKPIIEELRSPSDAAAAFSILKGAEDETSPGRISNTKTFTAEPLGRHHNLLRRVTSPIVDTEDPSESRSLTRRSTAPLSTLLALQEKTKSPNAPEINDTLTQEPQSPSHNQDPAYQTSAKANTKRPKVPINISNTDHHYGRLIILALTVADSIFPPFEDTFLEHRLERGDLAEYGLQIEMLKDEP